jgi:hypothetical protein
MRPSPFSTSLSDELSSQTSEQERDTLRHKLDEFFRKPADAINPVHCWLETTASPPVRRRVTDPLHRRIATQIICDDAQDETPFVKLVRFVIDCTYW